MSEATITTVDTLEATLAEAKSALDAANTKAAEAVTAIMAVQPVDFVALAAASKPVADAQGAVDRATKALETGRASSRFNESVEMRQPIIDTLHEMLVENKVTASVLAIDGTIRFEDGKAVVTLTPRIDRPSLDSIAEAIATMTDVEGFTKLEIPGIDIKVADLDKENATISLSISGAKAATPRATTGGASTTGTRTGTLEYEFDGKWLSAREFLTALETANHQYVTDHAQAFQTALHGTGNGLSNLAKAAAGPKGLNVNSREKVASE